MSVAEFSAAQDESPETAEPSPDDYARAFRAPPELASPFGATNVGDRWVLVLPDEKGAK